MTGAPVPSDAAVPPPDTWARRWGRRCRHSLGLRLVGLFLALALATSLVFNLGMKTALGQGWRDVIRPLVADYLDRLAADIGSPPDRARAQALTERLPLAIRIDGPEGSWQSGRLWVEDHAPGRSEWLTRTTADGHRLRFGLDTEAWLERPRTIGGFTLAGLLLLTALAWAVVHRLFRPVREIGAGAQRYGRGDFSQPIPVRRHDELGELAGHVNTMAADLAGLLDAKRALLLAVSHELRSPLTRARLNAELVAEGPERDALLRDLAVMRDLIADLLESERLAQPHVALQREPVDLAALVAEVRERHFAGLPLDTDGLDTVPAAAMDRTRLALLLRNLIDNTRRHAGGATRPPQLQVRWTPRDGGWLALRLRDHGPGVPPDQLARLAEPFHRLDPARQRSTGGVGLGLTLSRQVAQAHGGWLRFEAAQPGLVACVGLPWPAGPARPPNG